MAEERRVDMTDLVFKVGEIHARTERIPILEKELSKQNKRISDCSSRSKILHTGGAFAGGMAGGFIAIIGKKLMIG